ncbi:MAG TPA: PHP domain-containing protein, partial [Casimicrobiaceae bacterium]|nr:PHP domain-containing protein [Casimicrobiaceae bacterium]
MRATSANTGTSSSIAAASTASIATTSLNSGSSTRAMTAKFPISCEYDQLSNVPGKYGGTRKESQPEKETPRVRRPKRPYAELRAASAFSFLDGASLPEDLIYQAAQQDVPAMALVDTNGVYGAPRFYGAAKKAGLKALVGAELILESGGRATALVENRTGYKNLCKLITAGAATREKGKARFTWELIEQYAEGLHCLTRDDDATVGKIAGIFKGRTHVELQRHSIREEEHHNQRLIALARTLKLPLVATNGIRYARDEDKPLHDVLTCIREGRNLDTAGRLLGVNRQRHIKGAAEMLALFKDIPEAVSNAWELSQCLTFTLANLGYQ